MANGAVVQARMSSSRLPGKVLLPLADRPMLGWVLESLRHAEGLDRIVVATSTESEDDAVAAWCVEEGVECFRGSLDDVAGRLLAAGEAHALEAIARVNGDSPLLDRRLVAQGCTQFSASGADVVTNVHPRRTC